MKKIILVFLITFLFSKEYAVTITSEDETVDYSVTDFSLGYSLSDNSSVSMNYASTDRSGEDDNKTWISLNIGF